MTVSRKTQGAIGLAVGVAALTALFAWRGVDQVAGLLAEGGWALLLVSLFAIPDQVLHAEAWRRLFPPDARPAPVKTLGASWMGAAVNSLLPVATIGGELVKARVLILWGRPAAATLASITVDKTMQAVTILILGLSGAGFLAAAAEAPEAVTGILVGAGLLAIGIAGFVAVQLRGGFSLIAGKLAGRVGEDAGASVVAGAGDMESAMREMYAHPARLVAAVALRVGQQLILAGEVMLAGHLMGAPVGLLDAVILRTVVQALRGMSFAVPAGLGIQEGGFVAIGALIGQPPDLMLAVSLATRLREILPGIPFLFAWQAAEGHAYWRRRRDTEAAGETGAD